VSDDLEIERLMAMSDEAIIAEARAEGIDTDKLAYEMAKQFKVIAKLVRERDKARELLGRSWIRNARMSREAQDLERMIRRAIPALSELIDTSSTEATNRAVGILMDMRAWRDSRDGE
jgi:hypothetical protein